MAKAATSAKTIKTAKPLRYQSGFGNEFASEAVEGVLPLGQNSPQKVAHGLYTEQLSGTAFTAPRAVNRRTWLYRIRPSVAHKPFQPISPKRLRSAPFDEVPTPPNQLRWMPIPVPSEPTDFIDGLVTMAGNGNTHIHSGVGIHIYVANTSMTERFFYNADGEMLIVPQMGRLLLRTEMGLLAVGSGRDRGHSARNPLSSRTAAKRSARIHLRKLWCPFSPARPRSNWREWPGESA